MMDDLDAIERDHRQWTHTETGHGPESICAECHQAWPCDASVLLARVRTAEAALASRIASDVEEALVESERIHTVETAYDQGKRDGESALRRALLNRVKDDGPDEGMLIMDQHTLSVFSTVEDN